jgi:hypothetical protein
VLDIDFYQRIINATCKKIKMHELHDVLYQLEKEGLLEITEHSRSLKYHNERLRLYFMRVRQSGRGYIEIHGPYKEDL